MSKSYNNIHYERDSPSSSDDEMFNPSYGSRRKTTSFFYIKKFKTRKIVIGALLGLVFVLLYLLFSSHSVVKATFRFHNIYSYDDTINTNSPMHKLSKHDKFAMEEIKPYKEYYTTSKEEAMGWKQEYYQKLFNNDHKHPYHKRFLQNNETPKHIVYRTIGNDLPPRHAIGQSYKNVKFILDNEPYLKNAKTRWVVNRIAVKSEEERIIELLENYNQTYVHIPFILSEYAKVPLYIDFADNDLFHKSFEPPKHELKGKAIHAALKEKVLMVDALYHYKNLYTMNNNGARNTMIESGVNEGAEWIFPLDGNCYLTPSAWKDITKGITNLENGEVTQNMKYFSIPMSRLTNNDVLFEEGYRPLANEEPQIAFRRDSKERFNENMHYGRRPKVEMLWRLKVPGPWDRWPQSAGRWEQPTWKISRDGYIPVDGVPSISWVARLFSGAAKLEKKGAVALRGVMRSKGVELLLVKKEEEVMRQVNDFQPKNRLLYLKEDVLEKERETWRAGSNKELNGLIDELMKCADNALTLKPFSVTHKNKLPPSGNKHDYYTVAPYYWPNPNTTDGLPYYKEDCKRVPGTILYDEQSNNYDRTRLASFHANTTCLSLAWYFTEDMKYAEKAATFLDTWFLKNETKMTPHVKYSQIRWKKKNNSGSSSGLIEMKDFYYVLDAIKLVEKSGAMSPEQMEGLREWFTDYAKFLQTSKQGLKEYSSKNNHGTYYDLQMASIAAFVDDIPLFLNHTARAQTRLQGQFLKSGELPHEMVRPKQLHYIMFTLQGWFTLNRLMEGSGVTLHKHTPRTFTYTNNEHPAYPALYQGAQFNIPYVNETWSSHQEKEEDMERMLPLYYMAVEAYPEIEMLKGTPRYPVKGLYGTKGIFNAHDGIAPFWNLGLTKKYL